MTLDINLRPPHVGTHSHMVTHGNTHTHTHEFVKEKKIAEDISLGFHIQ